MCTPDKTSGTRDDWLRLPSLPSYTVCALMGLTDTLIAISKELQSANDMLTLRLHSRYRYLVLISHTRDLARSFLTIKALPGAPGAPVVPDTPSRQHRSTIPPPRCYDPTLLL